MTHEDATRLFHTYVWPHRAMVLRSARFMARNDVDGDDLAQETLVKAFRAIGQFDPLSNAKGWLSAILRNTWVDWMRARGRQGGGKGGEISLEGEHIDLADGQEGGVRGDLEDPGSLLEQFSDSRIIQALRSLPEEIRWTLLLVDVEGIDHVEAAGILQIPEGTVKSRAHRGRRMLRAYLATHVTAVEDIP